MKKEEDQILDQEQSKTDYVCAICNKPAVGRYSPDLDVKGLAFCEDHTEQVGVAFYCLMTNNIKDFNSIMGTNLDILD